MTIDTTALQERIAEELYYDQHPEGRHRNEWPAAVYPDTVYECRDHAAAVLPLIAAEVRKGKEMAWDACYDQMVTAPARGVIVTSHNNPYREKED